MSKNDEEIMKALQELVDLKRKASITKTNQSAAMKAKWDDPQWKEKLLQKRKNGNIQRWTPEERQKWSKKMKERAPWKHKKPVVKKSTEQTLDELKKKYGFTK